MRSVRVFHDIGQRFLHDPVHGDFHCVAEPFGTFPADMHLHIQSVQLAPLLHIAANRRLQAHIIEQRRP